MSIVSRTTTKTYFETGDKPTQTQFENFIDSALFQEDSGTFGKAFLAANTTASAQNLVNIQNLTTGTVGTLILADNTTASAQNHLGGGTVGKQIFESVTTASATNVINQATVSVAGTSYLPSQITIANNATDANNDIDFSAGVFQFSDGSGQAVASALTKRLDAAWAAGNNQGGLDTGSKANSTWYHCFGIYNPTSKITDFIFSTNATIPTLPSGYTKYKKLRACDIYTDGSGNIVPFFTDGIQVTFGTHVLLTAANPGTSAILLTLQIPLGLKVYPVALYQIYQTGGVSNNALISSPDQTNTDPALISNISVGSSSEIGSFSGLVRSNTSSQIRLRFSLSNAATLYSIILSGWIDNNI